MRSDRVFKCRYCGFVAGSVASTDSPQVLKTTVDCFEKHVASAHPKLADPLLALEVDQTWREGTLGEFIRMHAS